MKYIIFVFVILFSFWGCKKDKDSDSNLSEIVGSWTLDSCRERSFFLSNDSLLYDITRLNCYVDCSVITSMVLSLDLQGVCKWSIIDKGNLYDEFYTYTYNGVDLSLSCFDNPHQVQVLNSNTLNTFLEFYSGGIRYKQWFYFSK